LVRGRSSKTGNDDILGSLILIYLLVGYMKCYAHTINNAKHCGLILSGSEEGKPQWIGDKKQFALFDLLESNPEYEN